MPPPGTTQVWMMMKVLSPGMEHRHESDPRAQMFGVGGDLQEGFGRGAKENAVNNPLVLEGQGSDHLRQREDDVKVLDRQQWSYPVSVDGMGLRYKVSCR